MKVLINATNLGEGGAKQVADSFCRMLYRYPDLGFVLAYNSSLRPTADAIKGYSNVKLFEYSFHNTWRSLIFARDTFMDNLVRDENVDIVLSIFAPTWWTPKCHHFCGFALAHLVIPESPFYKRMSFWKLIRSRVENTIMTFFFWRCSRNYYTENPFISERLKKLLHLDNVYTISNYYNQVFDNDDQQVTKKLPDFDGTTILTIANPYPHKNLSIALDVAKILRLRHPDFRFRFVFTISKYQFVEIPNELAEHFFLCGSVTMAECPSLYEQSDIAFQPSLLECFTASYPEAMRMRCPIVTTNLDFARSLCGDAAEYYSSVDAESAADSIFKVSTDKELRNYLINNGIKQLSQFDNYETRADKLIEICKLLVK